MSELLSVLAARASCSLEESILRCALADDQNLGHLEMQAARDVQELLRSAMERRCPVERRRKPWPRK